MRQPTNHGSKNRTTLGIHTPAISCRTITLYFLITAISSTLWNKASNDRVRRFLIQRMGTKCFKTLLLTFRIAWHWKQHADNYWLLFQSVKVLSNRRLVSKGYLQLTFWPYWLTNSASHLPHGFTLHFASFWPGQEAVLHNDGSHWSCFELAGQTDKTGQDKNLIFTSHVQRKRKEKRQQWRKYWERKKLKWTENSFFQGLFK